MKTTLILVLFWIDLSSTLCLTVLPLELKVCQLLYIKTLLKIKNTGISLSWLLLMAIFFIQLVCNKNFDKKLLRTWTKSKFRPVLLIFASSRIFASLRDFIVCACANVHPRIRVPITLPFSPVCAERWTWRRELATLKIWLCLAVFG